MITYISGPMTGYDQLNFPRFYEAERVLREKHQLDVLNPAAFGDADGWSAALRRDLRLLTEADAIVMLEGWEDSRGANLELHVAKHLGLRVGYLNNSNDLVWDGSAAPGRPS